MALLYPWATKEYMLHKMSLGQAVMYFNLGMEQKFGKDENESRKEGLAGKSYDEIAAMREEMKALGLIEEKKKEEVKKNLAEKYGKID